MRVGPRRDQKHRDLCGVRLLKPIGNSRPVGGVAEDALTAPVGQEPVRLTEQPADFLLGTWVKRESEFSIERYVQLAWRRPVNRLGGKERGQFIHGVPVRSARMVLAVSTTRGELRRPLSTIQTYVSLTPTRWAMSQFEIRARRSLRRKRSIRELPLLTRRPVRGIACTLVVDGCPMTQVS